MQKWEYLVINDAILGKVVIQPDGTEKMYKNSILNAQKDYAKLLNELGEAGWEHTGVLGGHIGKGFNCFKRLKQA